MGRGTIRISFGTWRQVVGRIPSITKRDVEPLGLPEGWQLVDSHVNPDDQTVTLMVNGDEIADGSEIVGVKPTRYDKMEWKVRGR